jgi:hypothetical protein
MLQSNVSSALCAAASIRDRLESLQRNGTLINRSVVEVERVNNVMESVGESSSSVVDRQLTTQETNSPEPPVNGPFFVIDESDFESEEGETVDCVDEGSLPVMNVAN